MMQASPSLSERLLALLARRPVSEHDLEMTAMFTLDAIACIVGARGHPNARPILDWLAAGRGGTARTALRLGALSNILEMDSMHRGSAIHAGTVVVPAALAVGQALGSDGLWQLQRAALPEAAVVLDWWHAAVRFEHALQAARGLGAGTADTHLADEAVRGLERAKWRLWHGRWPRCRRRLAALRRWTQRKPMRDVAGIERLQRHVSELLGYLERNEDALVHYAARRRCGEPISTAFVESAVNEIVAKRMNKKQQMRWNRTMVQPFLDVRATVLNGTLEDAFRRRYPSFRPTNNDKATAAAA